VFQNAQNNLVKQAFLQKMKARAAVAGRLSRQRGRKTKFD
jgi:hypothetical protein